MKWISLYDTLTVKFQYRGKIEVRFKMLKKKNVKLKLIEEFNKTILKSRLI